MTMTEQVQENQHPTLDQAIEAARTGQREDAVRMLRQIVADDPQNADAWMWLGGIAPDAHEQRAALERAIAIAPHNQRARRGLEWLRETRPEAFAQASEDRTVTSSTVDQTPATAEAPEASKTTSDESAVRAADHEASPTEGDARPEQLARPSAVQHDEAQSVPTSEPRSINEDITQPMPVMDRTRQETADTSSPDQTARMPASSTAQARPLFTDIDTSETREMQAAPAAVPAHERAPGANVARHLLWIIWSFVLGGVLTATAISVITLFIRSEPELFQQTLQNVLAQVGISQVVPDNIAAFGPVIVGVLVAVALVALWLIIGLILRRRWAWGLNLVVAILLTIGAAALFVPYVTQPASAMGGLDFGNPAVQAISAVLGFALIFLLLSLVSRRAFRRHSAEESYGWE